MPSSLTYPGVYVEEIPSGVRTIAGVSTSVAAFVDYFKRGPVDKAVQIFSFADFEREFGGLDSASEASYALQQFFLNGGSEAWVVRVVTIGDATAANNAQAATLEVAADAGGAAAVKLAANSAGIWGQRLRARVDGEGCASGEFNLTVAEVETAGNRSTVVRQESFRSLSMDSTKPNHVKKVVNDAQMGSRLIVVTETSGTAPPLANGTLSDAHVAGGNPVDPTLVVLAPPALPTQMRIQRDTGTALTISLGLPAGVTPLGKVASALEGAIRAAQPADPAFAGATVTAVNNRLVVVPGGAAATTRFTFTQEGADTTATVLKLTTAAGAKVNVRDYAFGTGAVATTAQVQGQGGQDGQVPGAAALIGRPAPKTGLYALEDVDSFNLLCIPRAAALDSTSASSVISVAEVYCEKRRAFFLLDTPSTVSDVQGIKEWLANNGTLRHRNAALYFPRVRIPDPLDNYRLRSVGASGTVAGLYARTDTARGVWKAPAGTEATARNVAELGRQLTDGETGALNPQAINCLRNFPAYGNVVWGARTLEGSDQAASEWKYIPVRRTALFIEESLFRGLKWVVFEPNDEPLWAQIRLNVGAFMQGLFRQGAFQGQTPREAYFVKCDKETTTQNDINLGIVNIVVGFAPLKPAEFVVLKLQQMAGQIAT